VVEEYEGVTWQEPPPRHRRPDTSHAALYVALQENPGRWALFDHCPSGRLPNCGNTPLRRRGYKFRSQKQPDGSTKVWIKWEPKR
jgi:hypothetical protein